jgi:hypothetical protein
MAAAAAMLMKMTMTMTNFMDMTSSGWDSSEESDWGQEGGTLSDREGRNKGGLNERSGGIGGAIGSIQRRRH